MKSTTIFLLAMSCACAALADGLSYELTNCWRVSEFAISGAGLRSRTADFSFLKTVKKDTFNAWTNGVSIDSFYAYSSTGACSRIRRANPKSNLCGVYAAITNGVHALSILGVRELAMELVFPIEFDQERDLSELAVRYDAWQFTTNKQTALTFSACAVEALAAADSADWITYDVYTSGVSSVSRTVRFPPKSLNKARYMCCRWSVPKQSASSMLGITDLQVTMRFRSDGCLLLIR